MINTDDSVIIPVYGFGRAYIHAKGIFALIADGRYMVEVFGFELNQQPGASWIIPPRKIHAARQLAYTASRAFVEVCVDKGFDGALLKRMSVLEEENITYYVLCKQLFSIALRKKL